MMVIDRGKTTFHNRKKSVLFAVLQTVVNHSAFRFRVVVQQKRFGKMYGNVDSNVYRGDTVEPFRY